MAQIVIHPTFIWTNGIEKEAVILQVYSIQDNLETEANFNYSLLDIENNTLTASYISIKNDDYIQWLANDFATNWIMNWIAAQLNLTPKPII
jgi:hypothetical protein